jgi:hypothetical protein
VPDLEDEETASEKPWNHVGGRLESAQVGR